MRAAASIGLATGIAGFISTFSEGGCEPTDDGESGGGKVTGDTQTGSGDKAGRSPCGVSRDFLELLVAGDLDEALEYIPYEQSVEIDRADAQAYLSDWESVDPGEIELVEDSCETFELNDKEDERLEFRYMFSASRLYGRTHEVEFSDCDDSTVNEAEVIVLEVDESWYAIAAGPGTSLRSVFEDRMNDLEVSVQIDGDSIVPAGATGADAEVLISVIDENGEPVPGAIVIVMAKTAKFDGVVHAETGDETGLEGEYDLADYQAALALGGKQDFYRNQDIETLEIDVVPPVDANYIDEQPNPELRIVKDDSA